MKNRVCVLCYDHTTATGCVWAVRYGNQKWLQAQYVVIEIPMETFYRGPKAKQPRAYLKGHGVVSQLPDGGLKIHRI